MRSIRDAVRGATEERGTRAGVLSVSEGDKETL